MISLLFCLLISSVYGGCHTGTTAPDDRRLGIRTNAKVSWAASDARIYANVYSNGKWNGWRHLDNKACNDFKKGAVDYFDDFEKIKNKWEAISLYNCGNDGLLIEDIWYWDGKNEKQTSSWAPDVFGPFPHKCLYTDSKRASARNVERASYSDILIDGNTECCDGVTFKTSGTGNPWNGKLPGTPDCSGEYGAVEVPARFDHKGEYPPLSGGYNYYSDNNYDNNSNNKYTAFEQQLLNYLMAVIGIALLLFASNSCLMAYTIKNGGSYKAYFGKVSQSDIE